jgi:hypothetical protein
MKNGVAFKLGGISVPYLAGLNMRQNISVVGGYSTRRLLSGQAFKQTHWTKLRVEISADGFSPPGLELLDYSGSLVLECGLPRAIRSQSNVIALPLGRNLSSDYTPFAKAYFAGGRDVSTSISIVDNVATLGAVSGAISYAVWYFPKIEVFASMPEELTEHSSGTVSWTLTAEEK